MRGDVSRTLGMGTPFEEQRCPHSQVPAWALPAVAGRLVEISRSPAGTPLTLAFQLLLDAQRRGEPVAWIGRRETSFYPPDAADAGADLSALPVVWAKNVVAMAKAADLLVRSGAFGLVLVDLGIEPALPAHASSRLAGLAKQHGTAIVCLTDKDARRPSLGPLVSLRVHADRRVLGDTGRYRCEASAIKDKRGKPGWTIAEVCRGPDGLH